MGKEENETYPWDEYCESVLDGNQLSGVALLGREDGGIWGRSKEMAVSPEEGEKIAMILKEGKIIDYLMCKEKKYIYIRNIENIQCFKHLKTSLCVSTDKDFILLVSFQDEENTFNNVLLSIDETKADIIDHIEEGGEEE